MHLAHFLNRGYAWIALVAILWASLVPSLTHGSHAEGGASRQVTVDYCAPEGKSSLTIDVQGDDTPADHAAHHGDSTHCPSAGPAACARDQAAGGARGWAALQA